jgi:dephospho-CoA kinase
MIIGLTGSFGAGKGEAVRYLVDQKGYTHYSARDFIRKEVEARGMLVDRESLIVVANDLRAKHGPAHIIECLYTKAREKGTDAVIESLRATAEAARVKELGGFVLGIDADPVLRFERAVKRGSETDHVTFEEWLDQERRETNPDDPTKQDIFGAIKISDAIVMNNGSIEDLHQNIENVLTRLA